MNACNGSSSPGKGWPSFLPTLPSFTEPLPRIMILAPVSFSIAFRVLPRGPISKPTKFISGCCSCGIRTLSLTRVTGGLRKTKIIQKNTMNINLFRSLLVIGRWFKLGINALHFLDQLMTTFLQTLAETELARVQPFAIRTINWLRRW